MAVVTVRAVTYTFTERQIALMREAVCDLQQTIDIDEQPRCYAELNDLADELRENRRRLQPIHHDGPPAMIIAFWLPGGINHRMATVLSRDRQRPAQGRPTHAMHLPGRMLASATERGQQETSL